MPKCWRKDAQKMKATLAVLFVFFYASNVFSSGYKIKTGNEYYRFLNSPEVVDSLMAMQYMFGVIDTKFSTYCIPGGVIPGQLMEIVKRYLEQNPDKRHLAAPVLINMALNKNFPCR
jgi:hypothetical protein